MLKAQTIYNVFFLLVIPLILLSGCTNNVKNSVLTSDDLIRSGNWEIIRDDSSAKFGYKKLKNEIWLMHFLHWWPLNECQETISIEYSKELLMSLWVMPFTLTGIEGETQVNGHRAFFVEGRLGNMVKTRFIVWNCPESNRQFLSDCNINTSLNTPEEFFLIQTDHITQSVCCHKNVTINEDQHIPQVVNHEELNLACSIPANWRSGFYEETPCSDNKKPGHHQQGITEHRGTIWNLSTESEKEISFIWKRCTTELSIDHLSIIMKEFFSDNTISMKDTLVYRSFYTNTMPQSIETKNNYIECVGTVDRITDIVGYAPVDTSHFKYKIFYWRNSEIEYLVVATMASLTNIWGIPFDLAPSENQFTTFIQEEVFKNVTNHPVIFP